MEFVACTSCGASINSNSTFCFNCGIRIKCSSCNALLVKGSKFCSECGVNIETKAENNSGEKNTVSYRNTKEGIFCDVSLTNEVGQEGIRELIQGLTTNQKTTFKQLSSSTDTSKDVEVEDIEAEDDVQNGIATKDKKKDAEQATFPHLNDIEINVNCTESEWILIYAFYESEFASKTFTKEAVRNCYMKTRKTPTRQKNFAFNWKSLFSDYFSTVNDTTYKFKTDNLDYVKQLIQGPITSSTGKKKTPNKTFKKTESDSVTEKTNSAKPLKRNALSYTLRNEISFYPTDKTSLKDFFSSYKSKGPERILLVVHYMQKVLELKSIDVDCIYTAYKQIPLEVPNIKRALDNMQHRKGWIDTKNYSDLKVSVAGENHIDFKMGKINT